MSGGNGGRYQPWMLVAGLELENLDVMNSIARQPTTRCCTSPAPNGHQLETPPDIFRPVGNVLRTARSNFVCGARRASSTFAGKKSSITSGLNSGSVWRRPLPARFRARDHVRRSPRSLGHPGRLVPRDRRRQNSARNSPPHAPGRSAPHPTRSRARMRGRRRRTLVDRRGRDVEQHGLFAKAPLFEVCRHGVLLAFWRALFAGLLLLPAVRRAKWDAGLIPLRVRVADLT